MKINRFEKSTPLTTHEGGPSVKVSPYDQLRRITLACMLWEDTFYVDDKKSTEIIDEICSQLSVTDIVRVAMEAHQNQLRHIPLYLIIQALKLDIIKPVVREVNISNAIAAICSRPDQMTELVALYWKDGRKMLPHQMRKGLKKAFERFDEYQLAKYDRRGPVRLRDVAMLCHVKAGKDKKRGKLYADLINKTYYPTKTKSGFEICENYDLFTQEMLGLKTPDTWEVRLSAGKDKKESFTELLEANKMGALAIIRNLRNMVDAGVSLALIGTALTNAKLYQILPFQFLAAAKACPKLEPAIDKAMIKSMQSFNKLEGLTLIIVDVSGSMADKLSSKGEMTRQDAAAGLAILLSEICSIHDIFTFSNNLALVPPRKGMALRDAIFKSQPNCGTELGKALTMIKTGMQQRPKDKAPKVDRIIVITDEQTSDNIPSMDIDKCYILNVGTYKNGVGRRNEWTTITGFSENVIKYIQELEKPNNETALS